MHNRKLRTSIGTQRGRRLRSVFEINVGPLRPQPNQRAGNPTNPPTGVGLAPAALPICQRPGGQPGSQGGSGAGGGNTGPSSGSAQQPQGGGAGQGGAAGSGGGGSQQSQHSAGGSGAGQAGSPPSRQQAQQDVQRAQDSAQRAAGAAGQPVDNSAATGEQGRQGESTTQDPAYKTYKVQAGDCLSSIGKDHGLHWETIWNDAKNSAIKELRRDPNVIYPGDILHIRRREEKHEVCAAEQLHRFRALGQPAICRLQVLNDDVPRANEPYLFEVAGRTYEGTTDAEGKLEHPVPNQARSATVTIGAVDGARDVYTLQLGQMDPVSEVRGAQKRLLNLGFSPGAIDGKIGPKTEAAIRAFQRKHELPETGQLDADTATLLVEEHGC